MTLSGPSEPATNRGFSGVLCPLVGRAPREAGAFEAHLGRGVAQVVVALSDTRRREGVRRRDVGAGGEVRVVDLA